MNILTLTSSGLMILLSMSRVLGDAYNSAKNIPKQNRYLRVAATSSTEPRTTPENSAPAKHCKHQLENVFCGRGLNRQECPEGYNCLIDPGDRFAVCCGADTDTNSTGMMTTELSFSGPSSPSLMRMKDEEPESIERRSPLATNNTVPTEETQQQPYNGAVCRQQLDIMCGRSIEHHDCPEGFQCVIGETDMYAVCCGDDTSDGDIEDVAAELETSLMRIEELEDSSSFTNIDDKEQNAMNKAKETEELEVSDEKEEEDVN